MDEKTVGVCVPCMGGELSGPVGDKLTESRVKYWAEAAEWHFQDAALLVSGIDPERHDFDSGVVYLAIESVVRKIEHYHTRGSWKDYRPPAEWLVVFDKAKVNIADNLRKAVAEVVGIEMKHPELLSPGGKEAPAVNCTAGALSREKKGGKPKGPLLEAIERAYLHFLETGNTEILKPERRADFVKSLMGLVRNEDWDTKGNGNISAYISQRIKGQKTKNSYAYIETQEYSPAKGKHAGELMPVVRYPLGEVSKKLCKLRSKHPLPP